MQTLSGVWTQVAGGGTPQMYKGVYVRVKVLCTVQVVRVYVYDAVSVLRRGLQQGAPQVPL